MRLGGRDPSGRKGVWRKLAKTAGEGERIGHSGRGAGYLSCSILCGHTKCLTLGNLQREKVWLRILVS